MAEIRITSSAADTAAAQSVELRGSWLRGFPCRIAAHLNAIQDAVYPPPPPPAFPSVRLGCGMRVIAQNRYAALRASIAAMGILLLLVGQNALALCKYRIKYLPVDATLVLPSTLSIGRDAVVDTILYTGYADGPFFDEQCDSGSNYSVGGYLASMQEVPGYEVHGKEYLYQTNIPGIGVRVYVDGEFFKVGVVTRNSRGFSPHWGRYEKFGVSLVRTNTPVSPGILSLPSPLAANYYSSSSTALENSVLLTRLLISGTTRIVVRGCTVNKNNFTVSLPRVTARVSSFNVVGATAGDTPFNIALTCDSSVHVRYQINGASSIHSDSGVGASDGVLANRTDTGDAKGVAVQLLVGQGTAITPVHLGWLSAFFVTTENNQAVSIPFVARYYRTDSRITSGTVWAQATLTMNYP